MSFNCPRLFYLLFLTMISASLIVFSGCGLGIGEKKEAPKSFKLDFSEYKCLAEIGKTTTQYFDQKLNDRQIELFAICVERSLSNFEYYLKGEYFDPVQLKDYLNRHFLKKHKISEDFLKNIMQFKVFLLGGSSDRLSRSDLQELIKLVGLAKDLALDFNPYLSLIMGSGTNVNLEKYEAIKFMLKGFSREITVRLSQTKNPMRMETFRALLKNTKAFLGWDKYGVSYGEIDDIVNLFKSFKKVAVGGDSEFVNYYEWSHLLSSAFDMLYLYLDYKYYLKGRHMVVGPGLPYLSKLVYGALDEFERFVLNQKTGYIATEDLNSLINSLGALDMLPWKLSTQSYKATLPAVLNRLFRMSPAPAPPSPGLMTSHLAMMKVDFSAWQGFQSLINDRLYAEVEPRTEVRFLEPLRELKSIIKDAMGSIDMSSLMAFEKNGFDVRSMAELLVDIPHYFSKGDGKVHLNQSVIENYVDGKLISKTKFLNSGRRSASRHKKSRQLSEAEPLPEWSLPPIKGEVNFNTLSHFNIIRVLAKLLMRGWANEEMFNDLSGVSLQGMISFYEEAKPLGQELKLMDPRSKNSGSRIFKEGNLFTFSSDGMFNDLQNLSSLKNMLTFNEAVELISFVYSAGNIRSDIYQYLVENCPQGPAPLDVFEDKKIPTDCFLKHFRKVTRTSFVSLEGLHSSMEKFEESDWKDFTLATLDLAKNRCEPPGWIEVAEIGVFSAIYHYLDVIFLRFDLDNNNLLEQEELEKAFPLFKGFIRNLVETKKPQLKTSWFYNGDKVSRIVYGFVINNRRFPVSESDFNWIASEVKWVDYDLSSLKRLDFLKILGELNKMSSPSCH